MSKLLNKLLSAKILTVIILVLIITAGLFTSNLLVTKKSPPTTANATEENVKGVTTTVDIITIEGLDLHDGMVAKFDDTYYFYGTMYGCGFNWLKTNTPFCGFGVSTAPSLNGPWSAPVQLFSPQDIDYFTGTTWYVECGSTGRGCFNPRMIQRTWAPVNDGVFILWFNAPADYARNKSNAYYAMGCNGPAGPCGAGAGAPYGSTKKPSLSFCTGNGDFSIVTNGNELPWMFCTKADQTFAQEQIDKWGTKGTGVGTKNLAGLTKVEAPGVYQDPTTGKWIMTFAEPNCGYCAGTGTSYATAASITGPWTAPGNSGLNPQVNGRRLISGTSCGGQPRTISVVDGQAYQIIDLWGVWNGIYTNQAQAQTLLVPLNYTPQPAVNGGILPPQFTQWPCI